MLTTNINDAEDEEYGDEEMDFGEVIAMTVEADDDDDLDVAIWNTLCKARQGSETSHNTMISGESEQVSVESCHPVNPLVNNSRRLR